MMTARIPLARVRERMDLYEAGLAESSLDATTRQQRREEAAVWRFVHVAESQAQAEDELGAALFETRRHMVHARATHNPVDYHVEPSRINPWNDPQVSHEDGVRYSLETSALCGTAKRVADQVAEVRDAGAHHVLCQMTLRVPSPRAGHGVHAPLRRGRDTALPLGEGPDAGGGRPARLHAELGEDLLQMLRHGAGSGAQNRPDLRVRLPFAHQCSTSASRGVSPSRRSAA